MALRKKILDIALVISGQIGGLQALRPVLAVSVSVLVTILPLAEARATPHPLPFTYPYGTLPKGALELEQYLDMVPMRVVRETDSGSESVPAIRSNLETEIEYGISDHVEAAWYFVFRQSASSGTPAMRMMGVKQRVRIRFAETGELPVDLGIYLEVAEFYNEFEFEQKLLLSKRLGRFTLASNLWVEQEFYFQDKDWRYLYNPTGGFSYQVTPSFLLGLEYWARGRFDVASPEQEDVAEAPSKTHHYLGPTAMVQSEKGFASLGLYSRLDNIGKAAVPEDPWGQVWVRVLFGLDL